MNHFYLFFVASLMLNLTPGNDMIYVMTRSLSQGFKGGLYSSLGIFLGCLVHIAAAILGLSVIIARSAWLFSLLKYAGAAYLIYLGVRSLLAGARKQDEQENLPPARPLALIREGILTNALNPKVAVFFLSFLPQFVDPASAHFQVDLLFLGTWFGIQGTLILILIAFFVDKMTGFIKKNPYFWSVQEKITGLILIFLGLRLALAVRK